ncbi:complex I intermediate-associated protein 30, mitochondrial-like [Oscarella lobularis]|uniref:complex I intermediate-associated protein 30, mitochondrial-like n=1 Tax=Oscarella lobularis TaxID=121494 RepID=UPI003313C661
MKRAFSIVNETWKRVWSKSLPRGADKRREILLWDDLEKWACISDEEIGGMSHAKLQTSSETTLFHGRLSTNTPAPDSTNKNRMKYSGYCAIRSQPNRGRFGRVKLYDFSQYDALEFRLRGDGRKYIVNLQIESYRRDDLWQAFLYTRGGPFWEKIQVDFSDFVLTNRGYLQDHQMSFSREKVRTIGLLLADRINGPFHLELDYIKAIQK